MKENNYENTNKSLKKRLKPIKRALKIAGTFLLSMFLILVITGTILVTALTVYVVSFMDDAAYVNLDNLQSNYTTYIYAQQGDEWITYDMISSQGEKRIWVNLEEIPQFVRDAFVYSEDERFYSHDGVDFQGTFMAMANLFLHFWDTERGASTITQQVVKNITGDKAVSGIEGIERKMREIFRSIQVEKNYTKDDILECYLNIVHFYNNCNGVQAAANFYFNKDVSELTLAEATSIAAITKSPQANNPLQHPEANRQRQEYVLEKMLENGAISTDEYEQALAEELTFIGSMSYTSGTEADGEGTSALSAYDNFDDVSSYYVDAVIEQALEIFQDTYGIDREAATEKLYSGGYQIYSCVDLDVQKAVEEKFLDSSNFSSTVLDDPPQAAFIAMDYTGHIIAVIGGVGEKPYPRCLNRANQAIRQPGSCIKPISAYGPAIDLDLITWSTRFKDVPLKILNTDEGGTMLWPKNYSTSGNYGAWSGEYNFAYECLNRSLNTTAAQIIEMLTPSAAFNFLKNDVKLSTLVTYEDGRTDIARSPMSVGALTNGVYLEELVAAYQIFGNLGKYYEPTYISRILDRDGEEVYVHKFRASQVLDESSAYVMNRMMETVVTSSRGTGRAAKLNNVELIAKTGTTQDWKDLLFVGCTPEYVSGIWYGYDIPKEIPTGTYYSSSQIWKNIFGEIADAGTITEFPASSSVVTREYCLESGLLAGSRCTETAVGYYKRSNIPVTCSGDHTGLTDDSTFIETEEVRNS